jgi:hypothetical protein
MTRSLSGAALSAVLGLSLAGCASSAKLPPAYRPPRPPAVKAVKEGVTKAAAEAKLTGALEISAVRHSDHGPGSYFLCLRQRDPSVGRRTSYSVFFEGDSYNGIQSSVIFEACEAEPWAPLD